MGRYEGFEIPGAAFLIALVVLGVHFISAIERGSPTAFQRGGAFVILVGIVLAGIPYLSPATIDVQAADRLPRLGGLFLGGPDTDEHNRRREESRPAARGAVIAERFVAFGLIVSGTLINGYGDLLLGARF